MSILHRRLATEVIRGRTLIFNTKPTNCIPGLTFRRRMTTPVGTGIASGPLTDAIKEDHQEVRSIQKDKLKRKRNKLNYYFLFLLPFSLTDNRNLQKKDV